MAHFIGKFCFPYRETEARGKALGPQLSRGPLGATAGCNSGFLGGEEEVEGLPQPPAAARPTHVETECVLGGWWDTGAALLASPDAVTGAWRWLRQRSREGLTSPGWWEPPGRLPRAGLAPAGKSRHPLNLKNCLGETGPLHFPCRAEPRGCSRPWAGEVGVLGGSGARIAPALPQPSPAPFAASQQLLKAEKKKRKGLKSTLKSRAGRSARVPGSPIPSCCCQRLPALSADAAEPAGSFP